MTGEPLPDGDGGRIYVSETTGSKGRRRLVLSRAPDGDDIRIGPKAALGLAERLREFAYRPPRRRGETTPNQGKSG